MPAPKRIEDQWLAQDRQDLRGQQVDAHKLRTFSRVRGQGDDADAAVVQKTLPTIEHHLEKENCPPTTSA
jgi:hypothetical protein